MYQEGRNSSPEQKERERARINVLIAISPLARGDQQYADDLARRLNGYITGGLEFNILRAENIEDAENMLDQADILVVSYPLLKKGFDPKEVEWADVTADALSGPGNDFFNELVDIKGVRPDIYVRYDHSAVANNQAFVDYFSGKVWGDLVGGETRHLTGGNATPSPALSDHIFNMIIDGLDSDAFIEKMKKRGKEIEG